MNCVARNRLYNCRQVLLAKPERLRAKGFFVGVRLSIVKESPGRLEALFVSPRDIPLSTNSRSTRQQCKTSGSCTKAEIYLVAARNAETTDDAREGDNAAPSTSSSMTGVGVLVGGPDWASSSAGRGGRHEGVLVNALVARRPGTVMSSSRRWSASGMMCLTPAAVV